jgi:hypothetical protein
LTPAKSGGKVNGWLIKTPANWVLNGGYVVGAGGNFALSAVQGNPEIPEEPAKKNYSFPLALHLDITGSGNSSATAIKRYGDSMARQQHFTLLNAQRACRGRHS